MRTRSARTPSARSPSRLSAPAVLRSARPPLPRVPIPLLRLPLLLVALLLVGCGITRVERNDPPETAVVELDRESRTAPLRLVTSTNFVRSATDGTPIVTTADTVEVDTPYQRAFDIRDAGRFYVEAASPDSSEATITLRIRIDGEEQFNETQTVTHQRLRFAFVFRGFGG